MMIRTYNPHLLCLVKSRANYDHVNRFATKVPRNWDWAAIEAVGFSGGIFVFWNNDFGHVMPIAISPKALHLVVSNHFLKNCIIFVVYNSSRFRS